MEFPIIEMLVKYVNSMPQRLHVPGHKGRIDSVDFSTTALSDFKSALERIAKYDITELSFSDNLFNPQAAIKRSQELFAQAAGVKYSHFSVNGSTAGIFAMVNACGRIITERASHVSVFKAMRTLNKRAYVVDNRVIDGISMPIGVEEIKLAVKKCFKKPFSHGVDAVLINGASYYGLRAEVQEIYEFLKPRGIKLFVDGAHGAHYGESFLPKSFAGHCDAFVTSTHKTYGSFTQSAVLNVNCEELNTVLKQSLNAFTSTSPSYILLASLDFARAMFDKARNNYAMLHASYEKFVKNAEKNNICVFKNDDFTRLVLSMRGISGERLYREMEGRGCYCEFYDKKRIIIIVSPYDDANVYDIIMHTLLGIAKECNVARRVGWGQADGSAGVSLAYEGDEADRLKACNTASEINNANEPKAGLRLTNSMDSSMGRNKKADNRSFRCVKLASKFDAPVFLCSLDESIGKICADDIFSFPPSIPILLKGEKILSRHINAILDADGKIEGLHEGEIYVFDNKQPFCVRSH